jgi:hypothetical protein
MGNKKFLYFNCYIRIIMICTICEISQIVQIYMHFILSFKCDIFDDNIVVENKCLRQVKNFKYPICEVRFENAKDIQQ